MSHTLNLTDGTTTVELNSGANSLLSYIPRVPEREGDPVREPARVLVTGANPAAIQTTVRTIEQLLSRAAVYQASRAGAPVYIQFQPNGAGEMMRSEVLAGYVTMDDDFLDYEWIGLKVEVAVNWTRRPFWEADVETELPLANVTTPNKQTGGVGIVNHGTDVVCNYVEVAGDDVGGVLPAPVRLVITDTYASGQSFRFLIGSTYRPTFVNFPHILQGEASTGGGTPQNDGGCSGGQYMLITWASSAETAFAKWVLNNAQVTACAGAYYRLLARLRSKPASGITVRGTLNLTALDTALVASTPYTQLDTGECLQDLGGLQIPPWLEGESPQNQLELKLRATKTNGGSLELDFLALMPVESFRILTAIGQGALQNYKVVEDGPRGLTWVETGPGLKSAQMVGQGEPVVVWPGKQQRIYLLVANETGGCEPARTHTVQAYYRKRVVTV